MSISKASKLEPEVTPVENCRICKNKDITTFLSLGPLPTPNAYISKEDLEKPEPTYPLNVGYCNSCGLVQLTQIVRPDIMFKNYRYVPSASQTMIEHFGRLAKETVKRFNLAPGALVVDIGSSDGTLLKAFRKHKVNVLGIDPATNLAEIANASGIETINNFFSRELAGRIRAERGQAKVITATNVVGHIANLDNFFRGIESLLSVDGVFIAEFPYLVDLLEKTEFDTIYQEHLSYFSVKPLLKLLESFELKISGITRIDVHGGSLRIFVRKGSSGSLPPSVIKLLGLEEERRIYKPEIYRAFTERIEKKRQDLVSLLSQLKHSGKRIVGYGASARGNILLHYFGIDRKFLDYVVDSTPYKQGLYTPGHHIPIFPESKILEDQPDYALLLAWNFVDEILAKQKEYRKRGGRFVLIVPKARIV